MFKKMRLFSPLLGLMVLLLLSACNQSLKTYIWLDADGTILNESTENSFPLPEDNDKWDYIEWIDTGDFEKTASREPQSSYFIGNVFQVIVYNLGMQPIATGSGFVFNEDGWFITNNHVMEEGYFAEAIFDIQDLEKGESYTKLDINLASYKHSDKDIFIGKIDNYLKVGNFHYKQFEFETSYAAGDLTYSIGYPNSSVRLQINDGYIVSDLSSLYDKVYSGITYIGSTSFIAPGSSGGILVNSNLEVLGMTTIGITDNDGDFILGGAIEAFNYINLLQNTNISSLVNYSLFLHPQEKVFIGYYKKAMDDEGKGSVRTEFEDYVRYTYTWEGEGTNDAGDAYTYVQTFIIDSDGWMIYESNYYWDSGSRREIEFFGYYSNAEGIMNFTYNFKYTWSSTSWYTLSSTNINYSTNIALTLNDYSTTKAYNTTISESNIEYAKEQFNWIYKWLTDDMARFK